MGLMPTCFLLKTNRGISMIRKHFAGFTASALALAISAQASAGTVTTDGTDLVIKTKSGLEVATVDKQYSFKLGGRIQADFNQFDGFYTANNNSANEAYFRRAILELGGNYQDWRYVFNYDFSDGSVPAGNKSDWDEASIAYTGFAPVVIKGGRFDPDFGLQHATSSKWVTALERSAIYDLAPWINSKEDGMGIQISATTGGNLYGSAGIFQQEPSSEVNESTSGMDVNSVVLRGVFAPIVSETEVLHFGLDAAQRNYDDGRFNGAITSTLQVRGVSEDTTTNTPTPVLAGIGTGNSACSTTAANARCYNDDQVWGTEFAYMTGPLSIESEYLHRTLSGQGNWDDREAEGYNAQIAYTLTGESRIYKLDGAKFDAIKPANKKTGAWEVFYRYDHIEVTDNDGLAGPTNAGGTNASAIDSTKVGINTLGVNWYANEAVKISANYLFTAADSDMLDLQQTVNSSGSPVALGAATANKDADAKDKDGHAISLRAQYVF